jgi:membrane fusion protein (multidrug efflux system)
MPDNSKNRDGDPSGENGERNSTQPAAERNDRPRNQKRQGEEEKGPDKKKKFHLSKETLLIGGITLGVVLIAALLYWLHARNFESTDDAYTTAHVHEISARVAGTVESVKVNDNQFVKKGEPLAVLDQRDFKVTAEQASAQVLQRRAAIDQAQANVDHAQQDYDRFTKLGHEQVLSKQDMDNATSALKGANAAMASAKADLAAAESALATAELQLTYTTIFAPTDGIIAKKTVETGTRIQAGQALMAVVEKDVWVLGNFKETQLARMRVGQHVDVKIDSIPGHRFSAHIDSLQPGTGSTFALLPAENATGNFVKIVQRLPVKIVFDDQSDFRKRVSPGLSCEPKIDLRTGPRP